MTIRGSCRKRKKRKVESATRYEREGERSTRRDSHLRQLPSRTRTASSPCPPTTPPPKREKYHLGWLLDEEPCIGFQHWRRRLRDPGTRLRRGRWRPERRKIESMRRWISKVQSRKENNKRKSTNQEYHLGEVVLREKQRSIESSVNRFGPLPPPPPQSKQGQRKTHLILKPRPRRIYRSKLLTRLVLRQQRLRFLHRRALNANVRVGSVLQSITPGRLVRDSES